MDPNELSYLERASNWMLRQWIALLNLIFGLPIAVIMKVKDIVVAVVSTLITLLGFEVSDDPFSLRRYETSLLGRSVKISLWGFTVLLVAVFLFELIAWTNLFLTTGLPLVIALVMGLAFARVIVTLDAYILSQDEGYGDKKWTALFWRLALLITFSLVTSVSFELWMFSPEIDRVIDAREKVRIDEIRERAKAYETELVGKERAAAKAAATEGTDDLATRRASERVAVSEGQRASRKEISDRLTAIDDKLSKELSGVGLSGHRSGEGPAARGLKTQAADTRTELSEFDTRASQALASFDAETERMRTDAGAKAKDERAESVTRLDQKLHEVEVMPPPELAAQYGGGYAEPDGVLARYSIMEELASQNDGSGWVLGDWVPLIGGTVWLTRFHRAMLGWRIIMMGFGLMVLFVKYVGLTQEVRTYFSVRAQALAGHKELIEMIRAAALAGNADAVETARILAQEDDESAEVMRRLGYTADPKAPRWTPEVFALHNAYYAAARELARAHSEFRIEFRKECGKTKLRDSKLFGQPRADLNEAGEKGWHRLVLPKLQNFIDAESAMQHRGVEVPAWPNELGDADPRKNSVRVWQMSDEEISREFGWIAPATTTLHVVAKP